MIYKVYAKFYDFILLKKSYKTKLAAKKYIEKWMQASKLPNNEILKEFKLFIIISISKDEKS